jgi:uncharacterized protein involved in exopolysaccharide biosynthesis
MSEATDTKAEQAGGPGVSALIRARIWLIAALGGVGAIAGFAGSELSASTEYEAEAVMFFQDSPVSAALTNSQWTVTPATNPQLGRSVSPENVDPAAEAAAEELGVEEGDVLDIVHVEPDLEEERVYVYGVDSDPEVAAEYVNAFTDAFLAKAEAYDRAEIDRGLKRARATLEELPPELLAARPGKDVQDQIDRLLAVQITGTDRVAVIREAEAPSEPEASGLPLRATVAGGLAGVLLGLAIACWPLVRRGRGPEAAS